MIMNVYFETKRKTKCFFIFLILGQLCHGIESCNFRLLKNGGLLSKPLHSGKTFFDISVNTDQFGMGFEADTP